MSISKYSATDIARFWSKVNVARYPNQCWEWTAGRDKEGYGRFGHRKSGEVLSHRIAWEIVNDKLAGDLKVLHSCDNPSCVNPKHLFLGTQADNVADMIRKGRGATTEQRSIPKRGDKNHSRKLSSEKVVYIRQRYAAGGITQKQLALEMGVSKATIGLIITRKRWRD